MQARYCASGWHPTCDLRAKSDGGSKYFGRLMVRLFRGTLSVLGLEDMRAWDAGKAWALMTELTPVGATIFCALSPSLGCSRVAADQRLTGSTRAYRRVLRIHQCPDVLSSAQCATILYHRWRELKPLTVCSGYAWLRVLR